MMDDTNVVCRLCLSVETVNDGNFHVVELVASDQTLSLSIDGGPSKSINSISKQSTLNIDSPLYLGGMDPNVICVTGNCLCVNDCEQNHDECFNINI